MSSTEETTSGTEEEESEEETSPPPQSQQQTYQSQSFIRIQKKLDGSETQQQVESRQQIQSTQNRQGQPGQPGQPAGGPRGQQQFQQQQQQQQRVQQQQQPQQRPPQPQQQQQQQRPQQQYQQPQPQYQQPQPQYQQQPQQPQQQQRYPEPADPRGQPEYLPQSAAKLSEAANQYVRALEGSNAPQQLHQQLGQPGTSPLPRKKWPPPSNATNYARPADAMIDNGDGSPRSRRRPVWPPPRHVEGLHTSTQSIHWKASNASKKFVWPPPKEYTSYDYDSYNQNGGGGGGIGGGGDGYVNGDAPPPSREFAQQRADSFIPGPRTVIQKVTPRPPSKLAAEAWQPYSQVHAENGFAVTHGPGRRIKTFDEVIHQSNATRLPPTYRPPPGTQHVTLSY